MNTDLPERIARAAGPAAEPIPRTAWLAIFAGMCASLLGIGLARFAYTPLVPSLIHAQWFSAADVVYLGAANLAGYLAGAIVGRPLGRHLNHRNALRTMMVFATLAFAACAFPLSVSWFFGWRFVSGLAGGAIMVLAASTVLPHVPAARRGIASGAMFVGLGLGIAASGTLVPLLLDHGLRTTWLGLAVLSAALTAASWFAWPSHGHAAHPHGRGQAAGQPDQPAGAAHGSAPGSAHGPTHASASGSPHPTPQATAALRTFYLQYALNAVGLVPMMVFLVDFVARGLGRGPTIGAGYWVLYGAGAIAGPMLTGLLADRVGFRRAYLVALLMQAVAVALPVASSHAVVVGISAVALGAFTPGVVPLAVGRIHEILPGDPIAQSAAWGRATIFFALFQALSGYGYSFLFNASGGNYEIMFVVAATALVIASGAQLAGRWLPAKATAPATRSGIAL